MQNQTPRTIIHYTTIRGTSEAWLYVAPWGTNYAEHYASDVVDGSWRVNCNAG